MKRRLRRSPEPALGAPEARAVRLAAAAMLHHLDPALGAEAWHLDRHIRTVRGLPGRRPAVRGKHPVRWQDALIEREIPRGASVLDLGCGSGELLDRLIRLRGVRGQGIELDPESVMACVGRGVPVFQSDLDNGLKGFAPGAFDYVVLEETLQTLHRPLKVLDEMLRVGRHGIVSFPNFGSWRVRLSLSVEGRMPVTEHLPYRWHNTPNIHLFTLRDFLEWARSAKVRMVKGFVKAEGQPRPLRPHDNLYAEEALLFVARE